MKRQTILAVDDEERNIKLLKAMLMSEDYDVFDCLSGEEALTILPDIRPDLILLDVMMPGIDGFEVCRTLKGNEKTRMIPVVMVTALKEKEHRLKAMEVGADDFLSKPVDRTELLIRVKSLLRIKTYHDDLYKSYKEIEEKNVQLKELEKTKEGLMHMIIHDLRNPITVISLGLSVMGIDKNALSQAQLEGVEKCISQCRYLEQLIESLLDLHRMEEAGLVPEKVQTDVTELIDETFQDFMQQAKTKQISLRFSKPEDTPFMEVDPGLMKRVLGNLIGNAIRHSPTGDRVEVAIGYCPGKEGLCLTVRDHGNGIAAEHHEMIFDKFGQIDLKKTGVTSGTSGLGLAFCKAAVEAHGGEIWVESQGEGKGATFAFAIPN